MKNLRDLKQEEAEKLHEMAARHEKFYREAGTQLLKTMGYYTDPRYICEPGASIWTRVKVWFLNFKLRFQLGSKGE